MKAYSVKYRMHAYGEERMISLPARSKQDAYDRAVFEEIPKKEFSIPYSAWVSSVTHNNGRYELFDTFEGKPF